MAYFAAQIVDAPSEVIDGPCAVVRESVVPADSAEAAAHNAARLIVRSRARGLTRGL
jgi:cob(I)alamin adenosyltransferase